METIKEVLDLRIKIINNKYNLKVEVITITQQERVHKEFFSFREVIIQRYQSSDHRNENFILVLNVGAPILQPGKEYLRKNVEFIVLISFSNGVYVKRSSPFFSSGCKIMKKKKKKSIITTLANNAKP